LAAFFKPKISPHEHEVKNLISRILREKTNEYLNFEHQLLPLVEAWGFTLGFALVNV